MDDWSFKGIVHAPCPTPVSDVLEVLQQRHSDAGTIGAAPEVVICAGCERILDEDEDNDDYEDAHWDGDAGYYCEACMNAFVAEEIAKSERFAVANCRITRDISNVGWGQLSVAAIRHNATNYDELIEGLSREWVPDIVRVRVIRARIDDMILNAQATSNWDMPEEVK